MLRRVALDHAVAGEVLLLRPPRDAEGMLDDVDPSGAAGAELGPQLTWTAGAQVEGDGATLLSGYAQLPAGRR